jgi:rsbT co-antagonist protein RsbR
MSDETARMSEWLETHETEIIAAWTKKLKESSGHGSGRVHDAELNGQCRSFLAALRSAIARDGVNDIDGEAYAPVRDLSSDMSQSRALQGFSPSETATFVFLLKEPLFALIQNELSGDPAAALAEIWPISGLLDKLGLFTTESYQRSREEVIVRQQQEIAELSTPVVKLWEGVLALPLIGILDSTRTQVVMENLLQAIVDQGADIAIIDITGVPTVDTLVAQHLLKTIAAARLMGADCIISGIRPQIAQTMVHLGVELSVVSKASLADAFALALRRTGRTVAALKTPVLQSPVLQSLG